MEKTARPAGTLGVLVKRFILDFACVFFWPACCFLHWLLVNLLPTEARAFLSRALQNKHESSGLPNIAAMLTDMMVIYVYHSMSRITAEYQNETVAYIASWIIYVLLVVFVIWEILCMLGPEGLEKLYDAIQSGANDAYRICRAYWKVILPVLCGISLFFVSVMFLWRTTEYYAEVVEVYGIPNGMGAPLTAAERKERAHYWKLIEWPCINKMVLTYKDAYGQPELMRQYSTAYNAGLFQSPERVEIKYRKGSRKKYRALSEEAYKTANDNHFREPQEITYFSSNGKVLLRLKAGTDGAMEIRDYSVEDAPQLLNSTLLRRPDNNESECGLTQYRIDVSYGSNGLPRTRRLKSRAHNLYGINGERYTYDADGRLSSLCYLDAGGEPICNTLGIMLITFQYDENGNLCGLRYFSDEAATQRTEGFHSAFCEKFDYNAYGNLIEYRKLDRLENWCYDQNNVYAYRYSYLEGALTEETFRGAGGESVRNKSTQSRSVAFQKETAENGYELIVSYDSSPAGYDKTEDEPADAQKFSGEVSDSQKGQESGGNETVPNMQEHRGPVQAGLPEDGIETDTLLQQRSVENTRLLSLQKTGTAVADISANTISESEETRTYASLRFVVRKNTVLEMRYYDRAGAPTTNRQGYAVVRYAYDNGHRLVGETYLNTDGEPCLTDGGYAEVRKSYDAKGDGRLVQVEYLDDAGAPTINSVLGYAIIKYRRTYENGKELVRESYCDEHGEFLFLSKLGYAAREREYDSAGFLIREAYWDKEGKPACRSDYKVAEIVYDYTDNGNKLHEWYKGPDGIPANRADKGYAMIHHEYEAGRVKRISYSGYQDNTYFPVPNRVTGATVVEYVYENGRITEAYYFNAKSEPVLRRDKGYASLRTEYDDNGRLNAIYYFGTEKEPVLCLEKGCAAVQYRYNSYGQTSSVRYFDTEGKPVVSSRYLCAGFEYRYSEDGNCIETRYLGVNGKLMNRGEYGFARVESRFDPDGNKTGESYFDINGAATAWYGRGYASYEKDFRNGNCIETRYYNVDHELTVRNDIGCAVVQYGYDGQGRLSRTRFLDADRKPVVDTEHRCAGIDYAYDVRGNKTDTWYLDTEDKKMIRGDVGYAHIHSEYDSSGNEVAFEYRDANEQLTVCRTGGFASSQRDYLNGACQEMRYYDTQGNLILRNDWGLAVVSYEYDVFGKKTLERYTDTEGNAVMSPEFHCAGLRFAYNEMGDRTDIWYLGTDEEALIRDDLRCAHTHWEYDDTGNEIYCAYFDADERRTFIRGAGYSACESTYENGKYVESRYYNCEDELLERADTGFAVVKYSYDELGHQQTARYYDSQEQPVYHIEYHCAGFNCAYDENGNQTDTWYIGTDDAPLLRSDLGYAHVHSEYDPFGNEVFYTFSDAEGKPVRSKEGFVSCKKEYDAKNLIKIQYCDRNGQLTSKPQTGYAEVLYFYDEFGRCISQYYNDAGGKRAISREHHCSGYHFAYDERGNKTDIWYLGTDDRPMIQSDIGCAHLRSKYDEFGNEVWCEYLGTEDEPVLSREYGVSSIERVYRLGNLVEERYYSEGELAVRSDAGYAVLKQEFDPLRRCVQENFLDANEALTISEKFSRAGKRIIYGEGGSTEETVYLGLDGGSLRHLKCGNEVLREEYDLSGNVTKEAYYDIQGNPVILDDQGYASAERQYERGNLTRVRYFDTEGNLTLLSGKGYAIAEFSYDMDGNLVSERYLDTDGMPVINTEYHCAGKRFAYNARGDRTDTWYCGTDGQYMVRDDLGYAHIHSEYDEFDNECDIRFFDAEENPVPTKNGGYYGKEKYYESGLLIRECYLDAEGKSVLNSWGYAYVAYTYNEAGQVIQMRFYDTEGIPVYSLEDHCFGYEYAYDARGNKEYTYYLNAEGKRAKRDDTGAELNWRQFDATGRVIWSSWYIWDSAADEWKRVLRKDTGYFAIRYTYEGEHLIRKKYLDTEDHLVYYAPDDYAMWEGKYANGLLQNRVYYGADGETLESYDYSYDAHGNKA